MKNIMGLLGIIALLITVAVFLVACSSASTTPQKPIPPAASASAAAPSSQAAGGTLGDLFGRASAIPFMKYDMVTTDPSNQISTSTAWVKKNKMRIESILQGQNTVSLIDSDAKTMYIYMPAQNTAMKMDFGQAPRSANSISQYNPTIVGSETIDGKPCQIIQIVVNGVTTKEWIWEARGIPLRSQTISPQGTSTTDYKNYDFSDIPDSMFVLPAGVQISSFSLPTNLPSGLPTSLPSGFPTSLPSGFPTSLPSGFPTSLPSGFPTNLPTGIPTNIPTGLPGR